jgi:uncharacterized phage infection (PIP) family protein YhgE
MQNYNLQGFPIMQQTANPSLRELKRETEQTRAGLTQTVEQLKTTVSETASDLRQRISPEAIKAEVADYVRSRGERMMDDITAAARRNPMQAVAVGASVAYPLLRMARAIPLPMLLMGAGIFFAGSKSGQSVTQKASDLASDLADEVRRRSHDLSDQVGASVDAAKDVAASTVGRAGDIMSTGVDKIRLSTDSASDQLNPAADRVRGGVASIGDTINARAGDLKDGVTNLVSSATDATRDFTASASTTAGNAATSVKDTALETAKGLRDKASDISDRAGNTFFETIEQNPLLVAGVGLLLGGLIASALPRSEIEDNLVGDASATTKRRTQEAASKGFEAAKGAAGEIIENVARQAGAEGLTSDDLDASARDIGQRVRRVAETAVTTAFNSDNASQSNGGGGNNHG